MDRKCEACDLNTGLMTCEHCGGKTILRLWLEPIHLGLPVLMSMAALPVFALEGLALNWLVGILSILSGCGSIVLLGLMKNGTVLGFWNGGVTPRQFLNPIIQLLIFLIRFVGTTTGMSCIPVLWVIPFVCGGYLAATPLSLFVGSGDVFYWVVFIIGGLVWVGIFWEFIAGLVSSIVFLLFASDRSDAFYDRFKV